MLLPKDSIDCVTQFDFININISIERLWRQNIIHVRFGANVILPSFQVNKDGIVEEGNWRHIWMVPFLTVMPAALNDKSIKSFLQGHQVIVDLPLKNVQWHTFVSHAKDFFEANFMPFLLFLSGGIGAFHYEKILTSIGKNMPRSSALFTKHAY